MADQAEAFRSVRGRGTIQQDHNPTYLRWRVRVISMTGVLRSGDAFNSAPQELLSVELLRRTFTNTRKVSAWLISVDAVKRSKVMHPCFVE